MLKPLLHKTCFALCFLILGSSTLRVSAQTQPRIQAFTAEEWAIIQREYSINPPSNQDYYYRVFLSNPDVARRGGSGNKRWIVFDLGKDKFGNKYLFNSQERIKVAEKNLYRRNSQGRLIPITQYKEYPVIQITFNNRSRNGISRRKIAVSTNCKSYLDRDLVIKTQNYSLLNNSDSPIAYQDYDANGKPVASNYFSYSEQEELRKRPEIERQMSAVCYGVRIYPVLVELLQRGQKRTSSPSLYEVEPKFK